MSETTGNPIRSRIYDALFSHGFLGTSALAAATLSFTNVHAQERSSVIEGEGNQSANDPGPQNKTLQELQPDGFTPPPTDHKKPAFRPKWC